MAKYLVGHLLVTVVLFGCGSPLRDLHGDLARPPEPASGVRRVEMRYLGNGGWLIHRGRNVIATAPFVSNPGVLKVYLPSPPRTTVIDALVPAMPDVTVMLIGHGHYDHAMDLPHVLGTQARNATLYGSKTVKHLLGKTVGHDKVVSVSEDGDPARGRTPGRWVSSPDGLVRFMPLASTHAPHLFGFVKFVSWGRLTEDVDAPPSVPAFWPEGETLAFLIDFLGPDKKTIELRIYYQDAASRPGTGIVPELTGSDIAPVDVAILCVAGFSQVPDNPEHILSNVKPRRIVGGHWEDFFLWPGRNPVRSAPGTSVEDFIRRARAISPAPIYMVEPGTMLSFPLGLSGP